VKFLDFVPFLFCSGVSKNAEQLLTRLHYLLEAQSFDFFEASSVVPVVGNSEFDREDTFFGFEVVESHVENVKFGFLVGVVLFVLFVLDRRDDLSRQTCRGEDRFDPRNSASVSDCFVDDQLVCKVQRDVALVFFACFVRSCCVPCLPSQKRLSYQVFRPHCFSFHSLLWLF
jgi:hypothetical protein